MKSAASSRNRHFSVSRKIQDNPIDGRTFLIVTEGKETEVNYFTALRKQLRLTSLHVEIVHPEGTDPMTLTQHAINMRDKQIARARKSNVVPYDEVWVLFDMEKPHDERRKQAQQAKALSKSKDISFGESDPCFEYWLLLHYQFTTASFEDCHTVTQRLKNHCPNYTKGGSLASAHLAQLAQAVRHAQQCRASYRQTGRGGHPFTDIDQLVRNLNNSVPSHRQIPLE